MRVLHLGVTLAVGHLAQAFIVPTNPRGAVRTRRVGSSDKASSDIKTSESNEISSSLLDFDFQGAMNNMFAGIDEMIQSTFGQLPAAFMNSSLVEGTWMDPAYLSSEEVCEALEAEAAQEEAVLTLAYKDTTLVTQGVVALDALLGTVDKEVAKAEEEVKLEVAAAASDVAAAVEAAAEKVEVVTGKVEAAVEQAAAGAASAAAALTANVREILREAQADLAEWHAEKVAAAGESLSFKEQVALLEDKLLEDVKAAAVDSIAAVASALERISEQVTDDAGSSSFEGRWKLVHSSVPQGQLLRLSTLATRLVDTISAEVKPDTGVVEYVASLRVLPLRLRRSASSQADGEAGQVVDTWEGKAGLRRQDRRFVSKCTYLGSSGRLRVCRVEGEDGEPALAVYVRDDGATDAEEPGLDKVVGRSVSVGSPTRTGKTGA